MNFILIPIFAEKGAAFTTVLAEFTMMTMNFYFSRDITGFVFKDKQTWKNIFSAIAGCVGIFLACRVSSVLPNMFIRLMVSISCSGVVYAIILLVLKNEVALRMFDQLISKRVKNNRE